MRNTPVGPLLLSAIGLPLLAGGTGGAVFRSTFAETGSGPIGWTYVLTTAAFAAGSAAWVASRWRLRLPPCAAEDGPVREIAWIGASALAGAGVGGYAGTLYRVGDPNWAAALGYFLFLPAAYLVAILGARTSCAVLRILVLTFWLEVSAQAGWSLVHRGRLTTWSLFTSIDAAFAAGAIAFALIVTAPWREQIAAWLMRTRLPATPFDPDAPPRRA